MTSNELTDCVANDYWCTHVPRRMTMGLHLFIGVRILLGCGLLPEAGSQPVSFIITRLYTCILYSAMITQVIVWLRLYSAYM